MKSALALAAGIASVSWAASAVAAPQSFEFYSNIDWQLSEQFIDGTFDSCVAQKAKRDGDRVLSVGRTLDGQDFIVAYGVQDIIPKDAASVSGKLSLGGGSRHDFQDMEISINPANPKQKFVTIYLPDDFIDQIGGASAANVEFKEGKTSFSLSGSRDVVSRLNACMDSGLSRPMPAKRAPFKAPSGWFAGTSDEEAAARYIATTDALAPITDKGKSLFIAFAETAEGLYDIRFRDNKDELTRAIRLDPVNGARWPVELSLGFDRVFAGMLVSSKEGFDLIDLKPSELRKLSLAGPLSIVSLDPQVKDRIDLVVPAFAALGAGAVLEDRAPKPLALETLVGRYYVRGKNPDGKAYYGLAEAEMEGQLLRMDWQWRSGKTDTAQANIVGDILTANVEGLPEPVFYRIGKDGVWRGFWDKGRAAEWLVPVPPGENPYAGIPEPEVTSATDPAQSPTGSQQAQPVAPETQPVTSTETKETESGQSQPAKQTKTVEEPKAETTATQPPVIKPVPEAAPVIQPTTPATTGTDPAEAPETTSN